MQNSVINEDMQISRYSNEKTIRYERNVFPESDPESV